jgi:hypothetical protein
LFLFIYYRGSHVTNRWSIRKQAHVLGTQSPSTVEHAYPKWWHHNDNSIYLRHVYCARYIFASFSDESQYLFISQCLCFLLLPSLFCQPYTFLFFSMICPPLLSTISVLLWPKQLYHVGCYIGSHCLAFGLQIPYGWCQTILNILFVKLLLCKPTWITHKIYLILSYLILSYLILSYLILSYLILSYLILSYLILLSRVASNFFCLHHGSRFVCAKIKYFFSIAFYSCCIFQCLSPNKIEET